MHVVIRTSRAVALAALLLAARMLPAQARVAITIDDVPWNGAVGPDSAKLAATDRMIAALRAHRAPSAVFVNCARLTDRDPVLARWIAAGAVIGNHTSRH